MPVSIKNQNTKDLLQFISSSQLDNYSYAVFDGTSVELKYFKEKD